VWDRFEEANGAYDGVVKLLRLEEPQSLFESRDAYPILIERGEDELRAALAALASAMPEKAAASLADLEERHGWRRETIWAKRGEARLAQALEHLAVVAQAVRAVNCSRTISTPSSISAVSVLAQYRPSMNSTT
jgi:hypothetical protein